MPVYQYACTDCGEQLEVHQSFTDDSLTVCPNCSGRLRKILSPVGVVFKGSGFYRTDSRAATVNGSRKEHADGSAKDASKDGSKTSDSAGSGKESRAPSSGEPAKPPRSGPDKKPAAAR